MFESNDLFQLASNAKAYSITSGLTFALWPINQMVCVCIITTSVKNMLAVQMYNFSFILFHKPCDYVIQHGQCGMRFWAVSNRLLAILTL